MSIRKYKAEQIVTLLRQSRGLGGRVIRMVACSQSGPIEPGRSIQTLCGPLQMASAMLQFVQVPNNPSRERLGHRPTKDSPSRRSSFDESSLRARRVSTHAHLMAPADARRAVPDTSYAQSRTAMVWLILACGWLRLYAPEY